MLRSTASALRSATGSNAGTTTASPTPAATFSATIADLGYAGQVFAYVVDSGNASYREDTITIPFGTVVELPRNSDAGVTSYSGKRAQLSFEATDDSRTVNVGWDRFGKHRLEAYLHFDMPSDHESTVIVVPIGVKRFYLNRKINCMPVTGKITLGDEIIEIDSATVRATSTGAAACGRTTRSGFGRAPPGSLAMNAGSG